MGLTATMYDVSTLKLPELTAEMRQLMQKQQAGGDLSQAERSSLEDMKRSLRPHAGPAGSPEERRRFLRLQIAADVQLAPQTARPALSKSSIRCLEFSIGGLVIESSPPLAVGEKIHIAQLEFAGLHVAIDAVAVVLRLVESAVLAPASNWSNRTALCFVNMEPKTLERLEAAFDAVFTRVIERPTLVPRLTGATPAIADVRILAAVCTHLLKLGGLDHLWSADGPTVEGRQLLATNGRPLPVAKRVLLMFAWRLWTGVCDLRSTEFWHLDPLAQERITDLLVSVDDGPHQVEKWLDKYGLFKVDIPA